MRYWIRHDRPRLSEGLCYGRLDLPLSVPVEQTLLTLPALPDHLPIFSSSLQRCRLLAEGMARSRAAGPAVEYLSALQEVHFGLWEGLPWDQIPRAELDAWAADPFGYQFPQGESVPAFIGRVERVLNHLPADAIIITHAGVIRAALHLSQSLSLADAFERRIDFAECLQF